jgi:hypothetical protein
MKIRAWWQSFQHGFLTALMIGMLCAFLGGSQPDFLSRDQVALAIVHEELFDFATWELTALLEKLGNNTIAAQDYMTEEARVAFVREYLDHLNRIFQLEAQITAIYVDPAEDDPLAASASLRAERDSLREWQAARQALAESIIESQIMTVLAEEGFGIGGEVLPPVQIRFTQLPSLLIISPRDRIERIASYPLSHGLTVEQQEALEVRVDEALGVSSLVVPLGGLAVYPAMLIESDYAPHVFSITAHEWTHHYLSFYPLGFNYGVTPELYTINETTASIVGDEVGWLTLSRYYPDLAPPPPELTLEPPPPPEPGEEPVFDFRAEMHATRVRVDELLAAGQIEAAEAYMEERRQVFVENGYSIRKINQAYFAFHGAYAEEPGAGGEDPIGPMVREIRLLSPSLHDFAAAMRAITSVSDLETALAATRAQSGQP